jgi:hypothetical protein
MGEYKGWKGLSPPIAYPDRPWGRIANKGNYKPRHHVYAIDYYFQPRTDSILRLKSLS